METVAATLQPGRTEPGSEPLGMAETDFLSAPPAAPALSFTVAPVLAAGEVGSLRVFDAGLIDRRALDLTAASLVVSGDLELTRFGIGGPVEGSHLEQLQRSLRSTAFSSALDALREEVRKDLELDQSVTISVAGVSLGLSVLYVLWLIRGGVLMGSYLSALPAWRLLDPLPVLARVEEESEEDDEALDDGAGDGRNTLRGF